MTNHADVLRKGALVVAWRKNNDNQTKQEGYITAETLQKPKNIRIQGVRTTLKRWSLLIGSINTEQLMQMHCMDSTRTICEGKCEHNHDDHSYRKHSRKVVLRIGETCNAQDGKGLKNIRPQATTKSLTCYSFSLFLSLSLSSSLLLSLSLSFSLSFFLSLSLSLSRLVAVPDRQHWLNNMMYM